MHLIKFFCKCRKWKIFFYYLLRNRWCIYLHLFSAGNGEYYTSGNDLNNFANVKPNEMEKMAKDGAVLLK